MSNLIYENDGYTLVCESGVRYAINSHELGRCIETFLLDGKLDTLSFLSILPSDPETWEYIVRENVLDGVFTKRKDSLRDVINGVNTKTSILIFEDEDLSGESFYSNDFSDSTFRHIKFSATSFEHCTFDDTIFKECVFSEYTRFIDCTFYNVNFHGINLSTDNFVRCTGLNLSGVVGYQTRSDWLNANLEKTNMGYIAYKTFGYMYDPNPRWKIEENSIITEIVDYGIDDCSYGINLYPIQYVTEFTNSRYDEVWKCLIHFEDLADVVIPGSFKHKFRAGRVQLLEKFSIDELERYV
jgi:Pentapeptide repeats (9 copies)